MADAPSIYQSHNPYYIIFKTFIYMTYEEIIEVEKRNNSEELYDIHLYLENDWWRAYEWSAYLCHIYPNELDKNNKLKATHKDSKNFENGIVLVGLKLSSFEKYLPNVFISNIDDKHIVINIKDKITDIEFSIEKYQNTLDEWKRSLPYSKTDKAKTVKSPVKEPSKENILSIMQEVLSYPIENRTLIENTEFIGHLKRELIKLI